MKKYSSYKSGYIGNQNLVRQLMWQSPIRNKKKMQKPNLINEIAFSLEE